MSQLPFNYSKKMKYYYDLYLATGEQEGKLWSHE